MRTSVRHFVVFLCGFLFSISPQVLFSQSNAGSIAGTVTDPTGAVVPNASVSINNPVSQYERTAATDRPVSVHQRATQSLPLTVSATGFGSVSQDVHPLFRTYDAEHRP